MSGASSWNVGVPVSVEGIRDINTNLQNIQRSLSNVFSQLGQVGVVTSIVINAGPFLNGGTVNNNGTITSATIAANALLGNPTGGGQIPVAIPVAAPLGFSAGTLGLGTISATSLLANSGGAGAVPVSTPISGSLSFIAGALNVPTSLPPNGAASGYLSGTYPGPNVAKVLGVTDGSNATAGDVGEYISSVIPLGAAVSLLTATSKNITSITLGAGDWDVRGAVFFLPNGTTTISKLRAGMSTTTGNLPNGPEAYYETNATLSVGLLETAAIGSIRFSNPGGVTAYYLVAEATFGVSTMNAYGFIAARRVR
jgi:hypothetical protein